MVALLVCALLASPGAGGEALTENDLAYLIREAERWVRALRDRHHPHARPLTPAEREALGPFFPVEVVEAARVRPVAGIPNPDFYDFFHRRGEPDPIDFSRMAALSVIDTVLVVESRADPRGPGWLPLLFHELVHNTQRFVLGDREMEAYVLGWARGGAYREIPAEIQAYELAVRYRADPGRVFAVEDEVRALAWDLLPEPESDSEGEGARDAISRR